MWQVSYSVGRTGWPLYPVADSEALHFRPASESFAPIRALARCDLETLRLVTHHQGRKVPTVGGMIRFGWERERHFPGGWIKAERLAGAVKSRMLDHAEIRTGPQDPQRRYCLAERGHVRVQDSEATHAVAALVVGRRCYAPTLRHRGVAG